MSSSSESPLEKFKPGWRLSAAFTSIAIVNLTCALDATTIAVALPAISKSLHGTAIQALWTGTSFLLASTVWQPNFVAFSDVFGRRPVLLFALTLFTIGAIMCGVSKNFTVMLAGRVVQGSGVGGIMTLTEAIITDLVPLRERGNYFALISIVWAIGTVAGPLVGGVLAQHGAWRWIFYLNLPIVAIGFLGVILFLRLSLKERSLTQKLLEIDYIGSFIFVSSATSFLIPLSWDGVMYPWSSWHTLTPLLLGLSGLILFISHQIYLSSPSRPSGPRNTLLPMQMFMNRSTALTYLITFLHGTILWSIVYYMPLYFEAAKSYTPIQAGIAALPQTLTVVPCAAIVGLIASKTGRYRWSLYTGFVLTTLGCRLLYLLDVKTSIVEWVFLLLISGVGIGLLFPGMNLSIQASVPPKDIAIAAGLFTFFRAAGQSVGVAIGGTIFQNRISSILAPYPSLSTTSLDALTLISTIRSLPSDAPETLVLKHAFADAIKTIWAVMCGIAGLALIASLGVRGYELDQALSGEQGFVDGVRSDEIVEAGRVEDAEWVVPEGLVGTDEKAGI
ncbi:MFS general substrate transporter [Mollisia scopiformis]|uniref:MFS general substrate transporter n=1 Tax=Mollisia scopiformis TaxID=149040 RepID=A0A132B487_MOLSC|nr:MFS general substrate transporter [Mollisia scopiformis]KUJ06829.1 MFS general substrate transporter [Mollisia scopiformis]